MTRSSKFGSCGHGIQKLHFRCCKRRIKHGKLACLHGKCTTSQTIPACCRPSRGPDLSWRLASGERRLPGLIPWLTAGVTQSRQPAPTLQRSTKPRSLHDLPAPDCPRPVGRHIHPFTIPVPPQPDQTLEPEAQGPPHRVPTTRPHWRTILLPTPRHGSRLLHKRARRQRSDRAAH